MVPDARLASNWSYSRSQLYKSCPRALFYLKESTSSSISTEQISPHSINLSALVGIAVHRSLAKQLDSWSEKQLMDIGQALHDTEYWIHSMWDRAEERIIEFRNGKVDHTKLSSIVHTSRERIHTFFAVIWPQFTHHSYLSHEQLDHIALGSINIWVKVDLCTKDSNTRIIITDWKTGRSPILESDSLQLNAYTLWAKDYFQTSLDNIYSQLVFLRTGEFIGRTPSEEMLEITKNIIISDCANWESDNINDYQPLPEPNKCCSCRFHSICSDGK